MDMPARIWMTDTTFRDGQQSTSPFTVEQIVHLYKLLNKLGGPKGLIRQTEFFIYTEKDRRAVEKCLELGYRFPEVTSWIRASEKDFELVKSLGIKETGVLVSCSDYHIYKKMNLTRKSAMEKYLGVVRQILERGIRPRCHFEDITRADFYFVVPFAEALRKLGENTVFPSKSAHAIPWVMVFRIRVLPATQRAGDNIRIAALCRHTSELLEWLGTTIL